MRQYEQRKVLELQARRVQLLVRKSMCTMYATFDDLLSQLSLLSERRRLFNHEPYQAVLLVRPNAARFYAVLAFSLTPCNSQSSSLYFLLGQMGLLTMYCYEDAEEEEDDDEKLAGRSDGACSESAQSRARSRRSDGAQSKRSVMRTDHTAGMYLLLVGRAMATLGSVTLSMTVSEETRGVPPILTGSRLHVLGGAYVVQSADTEVGGTIQLKTPLAAAEGQGWQVSPTLLAGESEEVWLFLEQHADSGEPNPDMQLLLFNMDCHKHSLKLLNLPVKTTPTVDDARVREVLLAVYRLLKALSAGFKVTQQALVPEIPRISMQIELKLVCHGESSNAPTVRFSCLESTHFPCLVSFTGLPSDPPPQTLRRPAASSPS